MMRLKDGEIVADLPDSSDQTVGQSNVVRPMSDVCSNPNQWQGNIPPSCDNNGAFRRVYTGPAYYWTEIAVTLPASNPGMPVSSPNGDTGYAYFEGWPGAGTSNSEGGLQYSAANNWYTIYLKNANGKRLVDSPNVPAGQTVELYFTPISNLPQFCANTCVSIQAWEVPSGQKYSELILPAAGWGPYCCIFARMTTIAQKPANVFNDGSEFGPIKWSDCVFDNQTSTPYCSGGGTQDWPNNTTKIIVTNRNGQKGETDTIDLHP